MDISSRVKDAVRELKSAKKGMMMDIGIGTAVAFLVVSYILVMSFPMLQNVVTSTGTLPAGSQLATAQNATLTGIGSGASTLGAMPQVIALVGVLLLLMLLAGRSRGGSSA